MRYQETSVCFQYPQHNLGENLGDHIILYRHDLRSVNILQLLTNATDVTEGTLVEIIISRKSDSNR